MLKKFLDNKFNENEQGVYILIIAGSLLVILAVVGLAIDVAHMYRTQVKWQSVLDGCAVKGGHKIKVDSAGVGDIGEFKEEVEEYVKDLVRENLKIEFKYDEDRAEELADNVIVDIGANLEYIDCEGDIQQKHLLLGLLPGFSDLDNVGANARVGLKRLQITMLLDYSGSMVNEDGIVVPPGDPDPTRWHRIRTAAAQFINEKLQAGDRLAVVIFSSGYHSSPLGMDGYEVVAPMTEITGTASRQAIIDALDLWNDPGGGTNMDRGLREAVNEHESVGDGHLFEKAIFFMTDGAPNGHYTSENPLGECKDTIEDLSFPMELFNDANYDAFGPDEELGYYECECSVNPTFIPGLDLPYDLDACDDVDGEGFPIYPGCEDFISADWSRENCHDFLFPGHYITDNSDQCTDDAEEWFWEDWVFDAGWSGPPEDYMDYIYTCFRGNDNDEPQCAGVEDNLVCIRGRTGQAPRCHFIEWAPKDRKLDYLNVIKRADNARDIDITIHVMNIGEQMPWRRTVYEEWSYHGAREVVMWRVAANLDKLLGEEYPAGKDITDKIIAEDFDCVDDHETAASSAADSDRAGKYFWFEGAFTSEEAAEKFAEMYDSTYRGGLTE